MWSPPSILCRPASDMKRHIASECLKEVRYLGFQEVFSNSEEQSSLHCSTVAEESGERRACVAHRGWAPNQAPPCGARANRQPAAEVKDWQLQERAAGREGLLGNLDPSFPSFPNVLNNWKRLKNRLKKLYVSKEQGMLSISYIKACVFWQLWVWKGMFQTDVLCVLWILFKKCFSQDGQHWFSAMFPSLSLSLVPGFPGLNRAGHCWSRLSDTVQTG